MVPFIGLLLPEENLRIALSNESPLSSNVILRFRSDLGLASICFMLKINSGLISNVAQVQVFTLSCHKLENGQGKKVLQGHGKLTEFYSTKYLFSFIARFCGKYIRETCLEY